MLLIACSANGKTEMLSGNEVTGFDNFPENKISVEEAINIAKSYLPQTFELRSKNRDWPKKEEKEPIINVVIKGDYYYLVLENYPYKSMYDYLEHAVMVHKETGEAIGPK